jgi:hypothetical protein
MKTNKQYYLPGNITNKTLFYIRTFIIVIFNYTTVDFLNLYTSQQKKRYKVFFFKYIFMLNPKQLFIIIYVNVCVKRVYPHKTNNNILFRNGKIPESQFSVSWSSLRWSNWAFKSPAVFNCAVNKSKQFTILKIWIFTRTSMPRLRQNDRERAVGMVQAGMTH